MSQNPDIFLDLDISRNDSHIYSLKLDEPWTEDTAYIYVDRSARFRLEPVKYEGGGTLDADEQEMIKLYLSLFLEEILSAANLALWFAYEREGSRLRYPGTWGTPPAIKLSQAGTEIEGKSVTTPDGKMYFKTRAGDAFYKHAHGTPTDRNYKGSIQYNKGIENIPGIKLPPPSNSPDNGSMVDYEITGVDRWNDPPLSHPGPSAHKNYAAFNERGQKYLDEIVKNKQTYWEKNLSSTPDRYGKFEIIGWINKDDLESLGQYAANIQMPVRGARWSEDGSHFYGFLETGEILFYDFTYVGGRERLKLLGGIRGYQEKPEDLVRRTASAGKNAMAKARQAEEAAKSKMTKAMQVSLAGQMEYAARLARITQIYANWAVGFARTAQVRADEAIRAAQDVEKDAQQQADQTVQDARTWARQAEQAAQDAQTWATQAAQASTTIPESLPPVVVPSSQIPSSTSSTPVVQSRRLLRWLRNPLSRREFQVGLAAALVGTGVVIGVGEVLHHFLSPGQSKKKGPPNTPAGCQEGTVLCNNICVNTNSDNNNCGRCGNACSSGMICSSGICLCSSGTSCNGACVNTNSDNNNCGSCSNTCSSGMICSSGICVCSSTTPCNGVCVDTTSDPGNCGTCGNACPSGKICNNGTCVCSSGTPCSGACVDTTSDNNNCGNCGNVCSSGMVCSSGTCVCPPGQTSCGKSCIPSGNVCCDTYSCAPGASCCNGSCCPPGATCCNGSCCPSGATCYNNTTCCGSGTTPCGGGCCPPGTCCNGGCIPPGATCCSNGAYCNPGYTCCGSICIPSGYTCCDTYGCPFGLSCCSIGPIGCCI